MADIGTNIANLGAAGPQKAHAAKQALREAAWHAGAEGKESDRKALAGQLAAALSTKQPPQVASTLCQLLSLVGGTAEVATLKVLLDDKDSREVARAALERIPGDEAVAALVEASQKNSGAEFRAGAVNSLGVRGGEVAIAALKAALANKELDVRLEAADGLANYPLADQDEAIAKLAEGGTVRTKHRVGMARVRLAESLAKGGDQAAAKKVYEAIGQSDAAPAQKFAAESALERLAKVS